MENQEKKMNLLGLIGMILGILALVISFVPCLGVYAVVPGVTGIIFSIIGLKKINKGMAIAGLICSLLGTGVASYQYYVLSQVANDPEVQKSFDELEESMESLDTLSVE
jgi:hypothetical protein